VSRQGLASGLAVLKEQQMFMRENAMEHWCD